MPRDKSQSHLRIVEAAKAEFLEYGFADASLRRVAAEGGVQVGGLYKHFANKEEMFAALVEPVIEGFLEFVYGIEGNYLEELEHPDLDHMWDAHHETVKSMEYIYDHLDAFKLLICKSRGTRYENFKHDVAEMEEELTLRYFDEMKEKKIPFHEVDEKEFHLLVTANVEALFQAGIHGFSRQEAMHYAKTLERFYFPAWKTLFGIK